MIDRDRIVSTLLDLIAIDSPSGFEDEIAKALQERLAALGVQVAQDAAGNVVGQLPGEGQPLLLSAHMDTVEPGRGIRPVWDGPDTLRSDGSTVLGADNKAGCAVILEVVASLREGGGPHRPVEIAISRGEEIGLVGARAMDFESFSARQAIVIDSGGPPSDLQGQAPFHYVYDVEVKGRSAHAGVEPENGIPAIAIAADVIAGLPQGRLDLETTGNVGTIRGGLVRNAVPDHCLIECEIRSMSEETAEALVDRVRAHVGDVRTRFPGAQIEVRFELSYPGYRLDPREPGAALLLAVLSDEGLQPNPHPVGGGTDGNIFRGHGIEAVVVGRGGYRQHTKDEYLVVPEMLQCARVVETCLRREPAG